MFDRIQRLFRHRWLAASAAQLALSGDLLERLRQQVAASEQKHSGEIRIHIEAGLPLSYLRRKTSTRELSRQRALALFGKLRVWDTAHNNGVLIYLLLAEQSFELVADRGLSDMVPPATWQALAGGLTTDFKAGHFEAGLSRLIEQVGGLLQQHFPLAAGEANPNELPDRPTLE